MALTFDKAFLRVQFKELGQQRAEKLAAGAPYREQIAALRKQQADLQEQVRALAAQAKEAESGLFEIDQDRAQIARLLGGKTSVQE